MHAHTRRRVGRLQSVSSDVEDELQTIRSQLSKRGRDYAPLQEIDSQQAATAAEVQQLRAKVAELEEEASASGRAASARQGGTAAAGEMSTQTDAVVQGDLVHELQESIGKRQEEVLRRTLDAKSYATQLASVETEREQALDQVSRLIAQAESTRANFEDKDSTKDETIRKLGKELAQLDFARTRAGVAAGKAGAAEETLASLEPKYERAAAELQRSEQLFSELFASSSETRLKLEDEIRKKSQVIVGLTNDLDIARLMMEESGHAAAVKEVQNTFEDESRAKDLVIGRLTAELDAARCGAEEAKRRVEAMQEKMVSLEQAALGHAGASTEAGLAAEPVAQLVARLTIEEAARAKDVAISQLTDDLHAAEHRAEEAVQKVVIVQETLTALEHKYDTLESERQQAGGRERKLLAKSETLRVGFEEESRKRDLVVIQLTSDLDEAGQRAEDYKAEAEAMQDAFTSFEHTHASQVQFVKLDVAEARRGIQRLESASVNVDDELQAIRAKLAARVLQRPPTPPAQNQRPTPAPRTPRRPGKDPRPDTPADAELLTGDRHGNFDAAAGHSQQREAELEKELDLTLQKLTSAMTQLSLVHSGRGAVLHISQRGDAAAAEPQQGGAADTSSSTALLDDAAPGGSPQAGKMRSFAAGLREQVDSLLSIVTRAEGQAARVDRKAGSQPSSPSRPARATVTMYNSQGAELNAANAGMAEATRTIDELKAAEASLKEQLEEMRFSKLAAENNVLIVRRKLSSVTLDAAKAFEAGEAAKKTGGDGAGSGSGTGSFGEETEGGGELTIIQALQEALEDQVKASDSPIVDLVIELNQVKTARDEALEEVETMQQEMIEQEFAEHRLESELEAALDVKAELEEKCSQLERRALELQLQVDCTALGAQLDTARQAVEEATSQIAALEESEGALSRDLHESQQARDDIVAKCAALKEQESQLTSPNARDAALNLEEERRSESALAAASEALGAAETRSVELQSKCTALEAQLESTTEAVQEQDTQLTSLKVREATLSRELAATSDAHAAASTACASRKGSLVEGIEAVGALMSAEPENTSGEDSADDSAELRRAKAALHTRSTTARESEQRRSERELECTTLSGQLASVTLKLAEHSSRLDDMRAKEETLTLELAETKEAHAAASTEYIARKSAVAVLEAASDIRAKQDVQAVEQRGKADAVLVEKFKEQRTDLRAKYATLAGELALAQEAQALASTELADARADSAAKEESLSAELEAVTAQLNEAFAELSSLKEAHEVLTADHAEVSGCPLLPLACRGGTWR